MKNHLHSWPITYTFVAVCILIGIIWQVILYA